MKALLKPVIVILLLHLGIFAIIYITNNGSAKLTKALMLKHEDIDKFNEEFFIQPTEE